MTSTRYTYEQRWRMALEPPVYDDGKRVVPESDVRCPGCGGKTMPVKPPSPWLYACDACWTHWDEKA